MKQKTLMLVITLITTLFVLTELVQAQHSHEKSCKSECSSKCGSTTHHSSGLAIDTVKLCPVSGEPVDHDGTSVKFIYLGKEYEFCCEGCVKKFKAEPMKYIKEELHCPVMGEVAKQDVFTVVDGVKYYFCCPKCIKKFESDPQKYLEKLNKQ
ncbi:MAG: YHS domain-containing protein [Ignavibacteria bacterium]